jgi:hypothetical protein
MLRRLAGVSEAGARCRNPERSERISPKLLILEDFIRKSFKLKDLAGTSS